MKDYPSAFESVSVDNSEALTLFRSVNQLRGCLTQFHASVAMRGLSICALILHQPAHNAIKAELPLRIQKQTQLSSDSKWALSLFATWPKNRPTPWGLAAFFCAHTTYNLRAILTQTIGVSSYDYTMFSFLRLALTNWKRQLFSFDSNVTPTKWTKWSRCDICSRYLSLTF